MVTEALLPFPSRLPGFLQESFGSEDESNTDLKSQHLLKA